MHATNNIQQNKKRKFTAESVRISVPAQINGLKSMAVSPWSSASFFMSEYALWY
jgi:hypothetical protein